MGDGKPMKWSHPWSGGKEVPVNGVENGTIISKMQGRMNGRYDEGRYKEKQTVYAVLSPDGRSLTGNRRWQRHAGPSYA